MQVVSLLLKIVGAVFVFGIIIFVHELGHFVCAKLSKIQVNEFALGMGPTLYKKQIGETVYAVRLFPIGGFVAMEGEDEDSFNPRAFGNRPVSSRILTVAAGACMNLILGFVLFWILSAGTNLIPTTTVAKFDEAATSSAQLQVGDTITAINGRRIYIASDLSYAMALDSDGLLDITVRRKEESVELYDVPFRTEQDDMGNQFISRDFWVYGREKTVLGTARYGFMWTISTARAVWSSLFDLIGGNLPVSQVSGPVGTISVIGEAMSYGLESILYLLAFLSVNIGMFNILPFPALDGGRLFFLVIELLTGKQIPQKYEAAIHAAGMILLLMFMLFVTYSDVTRIFTR